MLWDYSYAPDKPVYWPKDWPDLLRSVLLSAMIMCVHLSRRQLTFLDWKPS